MIACGDGMTSAESVKQCYLKTGLAADNHTHNKETRAFAKLENFQEPTASKYQASPLTHNQGLSRYKKLGAYLEL